MRTLRIEVPEARSLVASGTGNDETFVEVRLRVPGEKHPPRRSGSVREATNPQWRDASFDFDLDGSGDDGEIEIRIYQGRQQSEELVGECAISLQKLPQEGFDRKPVRLENKKGIIRVTAILRKEEALSRNKGHDSDQDDPKQQQLKKEMKVDARYRGGQRTYPRTITSEHRDGTCDIHYDDGERELSVKSSLITPSKSPSSSSPRRKLRGEEDRGSRYPSSDRVAGGRTLEDGLRVEAKYKGHRRYYPGKIARIHGDGSCDVDYDDGEKERMVDPSLIKVLGSDYRTSEEHRRGYEGKLAEGVRVEAKYKGRSRYYPGKIARVHRDGSCDVEYDDGEKERMVDPSLINVLESSSPAGMGRQGSNLVNFVEGMLIEANYKGRGRYYPGKIARVHRNGSCDIDYDDGEKEQMVEYSLIKLIDSGGRSRTGQGGGGENKNDRSRSREDGGGRALLKEGMRIEARYKGGSRHYPGKIGRVHQDGFCDIDYDDGEKERMVDPTLINIIEEQRSKSPRGGSYRGQGDAEDKGDADAGRLQEGSRVEARYKGRSLFYPGVITRMHLDGSCDIKYDDGKGERMVDGSLVKVLVSQSKSASQDRTVEPRQVDVALRAGMKVQARYKGRPHFYPGTVARVHRDGTCDIDYDDGEKEQMIKPYLIKVCEEGIARAETATVDGSLQKGMKVEARYRGRSRYYPGDIVRVHRDGTCDIDYDDGEKERMVEPFLIKILVDKRATGGSVASEDLQEGMRVEARYKGRSRYCKGKISRVHRDGKCDIDYDHGEKERMVNASLIRLLGEQKGRMGSAVDTALVEGMRVEARYKGRSRYYPGGISRVHHDGSCDIDYNDGEKERMVEPSLIKALDIDKVRESSPTKAKLRECMRVEARYKGRTRFYPGRISRVYSNGSCDIDYDDGEKERTVEPSLIKVLDGGQERSGTLVSGELREGIRVEAQYKGRGRYYTGKISRVHHNGSCDIDYDDGEREHMMEPSLIRVVGSPPDNSFRTDPHSYQGSTRREASGATTLEEGMRVEARCKGRSRYYPGTISQIHRDGFCDIDYDDGENERMVDPSLVRALDSRPESGGAQRSSGSRLLREGQRIEARCKGQSRYYPGKIHRVHRDGSCDINYDDGEKEQMVEPLLIKTIGVGGSFSSEEAPSDGEQLRIDMKVEARYKGRSRYYPGKITRVRLDGSCDINYDDGEQERMVERSLIRPLDRPPSHQRGRNGGSIVRERRDSQDHSGEAGTGQGLAEGTKVEAQYKGRSRFYPGTITRVHRDGSCDIDYDDGEQESLVDPSLVKPVADLDTAARNRRRSADVSTLREGDRVEARYRGSTRYHPGKIAVLHRNGTVDIDYDDGEKETRIAADLVRALRDDRDIRSADKATRRSSDSDDEYHARSRETERGPSRQNRHQRRRNRSRNGSFSQGRAARRIGSGRHSSSDTGVSDDSSVGGERRRLGDGAAPRLSSKCRPTEDQRDRSRPASRGGHTSKGSGSERDVDGKRDAGYPQGSRVEACWRRASPYSRPKRATNWMEGRVLASHGDGTFTIKYADGQTEEDVPDKCMRVAEARPKSQSDEARRSRSASHRRQRISGSQAWRAVARMSNGLAKRSGRRADEVPWSSVEGEKDETMRVELLLGKPESARFRRAFDRVDVLKEGVLTAAETVRAFRDLGGRATEKEVCDFLQTPDGGNGRNSRLNFPRFVTAYAWTFYGSAGDDDSSKDDRDSSAALSDGGRQKQGRARSAREGVSARGRLRGSGSKEISRKLGFNSRSSSRGESRRRARGQRRRGRGSTGIGEEAELRRWTKRLGQKEMRKLEDVFDAWAEGGSDGGRGPGEVEVRDLKECFTELGREVEPIALRAWCEEADLAPGDALSLADFAYAFHAMFVDAGGEVVGDGRPSPFSKSARDIAPAAGHGLVLSSAGTGRRLDGGLRSVAEVAAAAFQAEKWEGTREQHDDLIRRVTVGRSSQQAEMLARARMAFEELDEDRDGEIPRRLISKLLSKVGRDPKTCSAQIAAFCQQGVSDDGSRKEATKGKKRVEIEGDTSSINTDPEGKSAKRYTGQRKHSESTKRSNRKKHKGQVGFASAATPISSTACLAEVFACFGFVFEGAGGGTKPSVAEAFAMLRLHAQPAEAQAAGVAARRYVDNVLEAPGDARFWRINTENDAYFAKLDRHKGGHELLAAVGFCDELRVEAGHELGGTFETVGGLSASGGHRSADGTTTRKERKGWIVLEGTVGGDGKPIAAIGEAQIRVLRAAREEVESELLALEGAPSVSAALRSLRVSLESDVPASVAAVRAAAELLLTYVVNALKDPRDPRVHRVRAANPAFQRALGRLGGCDGAMSAVGFEPRDRGTVFVLRSIGTDGGFAAAEPRNRGSSVTGKAEVGTANFRFPALDATTEAFLWRRKADLEAAIAAMPIPVPAAEGGQAVPGRATADLVDALTLGGVDPRAEAIVEGKRSEKKRKLSRNNDSFTSTLKPHEPTKDRTGKNLANAKTVVTKTGGDHRRRSTAKGEAASAALAGAATGARGVQLAMIEKAFERLDVDGDGFISATDLGSAFRSVGRDASHASIHAWIRRRDISQDGRVSLDEFVASFHALVPPDTPGWASASIAATRRTVGGKASKVEKKIAKLISVPRGSTANDNDGGGAVVCADDGATDVAASFGRIRLSGSIPQCRAAAEYALDYCRRVMDSPSSPLHWRIPLNSKKFSAVVGRLLGGVDLMQALGLRLEENGTVLALRGKGESAGTQWETVPHDVLQSLDAAAKELAMQVYGIDHPEVADLTAVSAAVARLRNASGRSVPHLRCVETVTRYLGNALDNPTVGKYRVINTSNRTFLRDVASVEGGAELMVALGFREDMEGRLVLPMDTDLTHLAARKLELDAGLPFLRSAATAENPSSNDAAKGAAEGGQSVIGGGAVNRGRGRASVEKGRVGNVSPTRGTTSPAQGKPLLIGATLPGKEDDRMPGRRKSESPGRTEAAEARRMLESLGTETRSRRVAEVALAKRKEEVERLKAEVVALKDKEASTLDIRDALTFARMGADERSAVTGLTSKIGLDMKNAAKALAWALESNKPRSLTAPSKADEAPAALNRAKTARGRGVQPPVNGGEALTHLVSAAEVGDAVVEVARSEIFRAGWKLVVGSGNFQERRFITAVVPSADLGESGDGGRVVLEDSLAHHHRTGASAAIARPGRAEVAAYQKRQVVFMIRTSFLYPMVDAAAHLGEDVLSARAAQSAFERRFVNKYAFVIAPVQSRMATSPGDDGGGDSSRGLSCLPSLGQVVSVRDKSTLVCHRETLSLSYLRRSFLSIGWSAWGKISLDEMRAELRTNPVLAAGMGPDRNEGFEEGSGERAVRIIRQRRGDCHGAGEELVTWAEFVGVFMPLGPIPMECLNAESTEETSEESWRAGLNEKELELLGVAFATVNHGCDGRVSLTGLRMACAELDDEEPPEAPVRTALGVDSGTGKGIESEKRGGGYSFQNFIFLRAVLARQKVPSSEIGTGGDSSFGFASGWKLSALANLRRVFLNTVDGGRPNAALDRNHNPRRSDACVTGRNAEVNPAVFAAAAGADPSVAQFLDMPTTSNAGGTVDGDEVTTLRIALRELGRSGAHAGRGWAGVGAETRIRWEDVEEVLFERYDPANIFGKPPSTVSVASSVGDAEEEIYQLATDAETGNIYVLMTDGEVRVYDAAAPMVGGKGSGVGQPMWTCQLITHDPSPRGLGTEGRQEYRRWRQMVGLDPPTDGKGKQCNPHTESGANARLSSKILARRLLSSRGRHARVLFPCPRAGLVLVNTSVGDRCVRFHETSALRRVCRTRLELPSPSGSSSTDAGGLFDAAAFDGDATVVTAGTRSARGAQASVMSTTECSLLDLVFLPDVSVILGLVGGRAQVHAFCSETGLVIAFFPGHSLPVNCMLWIPSQLMLVSGSNDSTVRVWDVGEDLMPQAEEWVEIKARLTRRLNHHDDGIATKSSSSADIAALEAAVIDDNEPDKGKRNGLAVKRSPHSERNQAPSWIDGDLTDKDNQTTNEMARRALRVMRLELLRQAGARQGWRTGRITGVMDRTGLCKQSAVPVGTSKNSRQHTLIEVTYDDHEMELDIEAQRLRRPEEIHRMSKEGGRAIGPDWDRHVVRPAVGVRVAVHGYHEARSLNLVIHLLGGVDASIAESSSFRLPTRAGLLSALEQVRARAASAVGSTAAHPMHQNDSMRSGGNHIEDSLPTVAALDVALETSYVADIELEALATELAQISAASFRRQQLVAPERRYRAAWGALVRAVMRPDRWLPSLSSRSLSAALISGGEGMGNGTKRIIAELQRWTRLRSPIPCKHLLVGHEAAITSLAYLSLSMLLASGAADGRVRLWDPCARKHKLAPPPVAPAPLARCAGGAEGRRNMSTCLEAPEEWTQTGETFGCIADFSALPSTDPSGPVGKRAVKSRGNVVADGEGDGIGHRMSMKVSAMDVILIPGGGLRSLVVCDADGVRKAKGLDEGEPCDLASAGSGGAFFYLMDTGVVEAIPTTRGFDERYVLLDDASFFEVSGPLAAEDDTGATLLRRLYRARARVLRIVYTIPVDLRSIDALAEQLCNGGKIAQARLKLEFCFAERRSVVFYRRGDGPTRDISAVVVNNQSHDPKTPSMAEREFIQGHAITIHHPHSAYFAPGGGIFAGSTARGSEVLRIEAGGEDGGDRGSRGRRYQAQISLWSVGRLSLRVEARSYDQPLGDARQSAAEIAFMSSWATRIQNLRALCTTRVAEAHGRASAEARLFARVGGCLRLCSLDRSCGDVVAATVGNTAVERALSAALRLPSRFPISPLYHASGMYLQAWKVVQSCIPLREQGSGGHARAAQVRHILHRLNQSVLSPLDHVARHFLQPVVTQALEDTLVKAGALVSWSGLRMALSSVLGHEQATTEEVFTLLTRFGQMPLGSTALEVFASIAERGSNTLLPCSTYHGLAADETTTDWPRPAVKIFPETPGGENGKDTRDDKVERGPTYLGRTQTRAAQQTQEAASVLLHVSKISTLTAEFDPWKRVDLVFASLEREFANPSFDGSSNCPRLRSPLQNYALARRSSRWHDELEVVGNALKTARLKLGRRGLDIILGKSDSAAKECMVQRPSPEVSAVEMIAEAETIASNAARRQVDARGDGRPSSIRLARVHYHAPLPERGERGVAVFDGWGYYGHVATQHEGRTRTGVDRDGRGDSEDAGEAVAVLEVCPARAREPINAEGLKFGEHMTFAAGLLSVPALRQEKGILDFHPAARVALDQRGGATGGEGDSAGGGSELRVVTERLADWRPLSEVILQRGPLVRPSEVASGDDGGLRILRLWGKQLAKILDCLGSRSLVLRDMRAATVFVSPDGSSLKVVCFSSLATLTSDGTISSAAPSLDPDIYGITKPITPPEAFTTWSPESPLDGAGDARTGNASVVKQCSLTLATGDEQRLGIFPATAAWDVWTLGVLLFELAFGRPPPAFSATLNRAIASCSAVALAEKSSRPPLNEVAGALQYDFLSAIDGHNNDIWRTEPPTASPTNVSATSTLTEALEHMSLGLAIGERHGCPVGPFSGSRIGLSQQRSGEDGQESFARFRRAWVRVQLDMEARGEVGVMTWQMLQEKIKSHLQAAVAKVHLGISKATLGNEAALASNAGGSSGLRCYQTVLESSDKTEEVAIVERVMVLLRESDPRGTGWVPFRIVRRVLEAELLMQMTSGEAKMIATCLKDVEVDIEYRESRKVRRAASGGEIVFYPPLKHLLLSSVCSFPTSRGGRTFDLSSSPLPATLVELLCICMEPDPNRRPSPAEVLQHPFISGGDGDNKEKVAKLDRDASAAYMRGVGGHHSRLIALRDCVERPVQALEKAVVYLNGVHRAGVASPRLGDKSTGLQRPTHRTANVSAGTLVNALGELKNLLRPVAEQTSSAADPLQAKGIVRGDTKVVENIFQSELLMRVSALALRFLEHEEADAVGRGLLGVGFVEGDPCTTVGARVLLALARVLETLLFELRSIDSAVSPYADVVLRCLVSLFLGEEGVLAVRYGRIGPSLLRLLPKGLHATASSGLQSDEGLCHWRPSASQIFERLLVEAIGETGEGGLAYPVIRRYIRSCGLITHQVGSNMDGAVGEDDDHFDTLDGDGWNIDHDHDAGKSADDGCETAAGDGDWASSSEDVNDGVGLGYRPILMLNPDASILARDAMTTTGAEGRDRFRSRGPIAFIRGSVYFGELLALGRVLYAIHRPGNRFSTATTDRARKQATTYCRTLVRMCCDRDVGGLEKAEPAGWTAGGRQNDEDGSTLQRIQLLVDVRLAEKLAPYLNDHSADVRRDAIICALSALRGGNTQLRWASPTYGNKGVVDPRTLLALSFCTPVWVSGLTGIVRGQDSSALGSAKPNRSAREAEDSLKKEALSCLGYMATAGDLATQNWPGVRVLSALQGVLSREVSGTGSAVMSGKPGGHSNSETVGGTGSARFKEWPTGVLDVLHALAENGSGTTHAMLRSNRALSTRLRIPELHVPDALTSKGVAVRAAELLRGGTHDEIVSLVCRTRSVLGRAVQLGDTRVFGSGDDGISEDIGFTTSLVWGWMQRALVQLTRDSTDHPSTEARVALAQECLALMRLLLTSRFPPAFRLVHCRINPTIAVEMSRTSGVLSAPEDGTYTPSNANTREERSSAKVELAEARTGLELVVRLLSAEESKPLQVHRAHPIPVLSAQAADTVGEAITYGNRDTLDTLSSFGLGLRLGLAVENAARLARESRKLGVEAVHLSWTYPAGRQARVKLLDRLLWNAHRELLEQVIISGIVEFVVYNMLPDCATTDVVNARLPASFVRYNGKPLVRDEGLCLLERVVARRRRSPAVAREMARQAIRHELPSAEILRVRKNHNRSLRAGVGACLRALARLDNALVDRTLIFAGVPKRAITETRTDHMSSTTRRRWARWLRREADACSSCPEPPFIQSKIPLSVPLSLSSPRTSPQNFLDRKASYRRNDRVTQGGTEEDLRRGEPPPTGTVVDTTLQDEGVEKPKHGLSGISSSHAGPLGAPPIHSGNASYSRRASPLATVSAATEARNESKNHTTLTIDADMSTTSALDLLPLLAAELGTTHASIEIVAVCGSPVDKTSTGLSSTVGDAIPAAAVPTATARSTVDLLLSEAIANRLYTRCLAGVLRVPGLVYLEIEGRTKLAWDGMEIAPNDPLRCTGASSRSLAADQLVTNAAIPPEVHTSSTVANPHGRKIALDLSQRSTVHPRSEFSWLGRTSDDGSGDVHRGGSSSPDAHGIRLMRPRTVSLTDGGTQYGAFSPRTRRERVATALDRMGGVVVEVRDAFQRWLADGGRMNETVARDIAVARAFAELRLPVGAATGVSKAVKATEVGSVSFQEFLFRYAEAAGLLSETPGRGGEHVWAEGPGGLWVVVASERLVGLRVAFDEATDEEREQKWETKDLHLERSLDQRDAIYILEALHPDSAEGAKRYVRERKPVLDSLYGGRVSFQEFVRAALHLNLLPTASRFPFATTASFIRERKDPTLDTGKLLPPVPRNPEGCYFDGMPGRALGERDSVASPNTASLQKKQGDIDTQSEQQPTRSVLPKPGALRREREEEERAAWVRRAGVGRLPPARTGILLRSASPMKPPAPSEVGGRGQASGVAGAPDGTINDNDRGIIPARAGLAEQSEETLVARASAGTSKDDPVARAFKKYALHREMEVGLRRASHDKKQTSPRGSPAHNRGRRTVPSSESATSRKKANERRNISWSPPARGQRRQSARQQSRWADRDGSFNSDNRERRNHDYEGPGQEAESFHRRRMPVGRTSRSMNDFGSGDEVGGGRRANVDVPTDASRDYMVNPGSRESRNDGSGRLRGRLCSRDERNDGLWRTRETAETEEDADDREEEVGPAGERALRRAFNLYDVNGDGFITHLELKAVFQQRGLNVSDDELRRWIKQRDTSGTGAVDFADFSRSLILHAPPATSFN